MRRRTGSDEGSALVIVLAFIAVVGLVVSAVLSYTDTSFRVSSSTRSIEERTAAADGGAKFALARLIDNPLICNGAPITGAPVSNAQTPLVSCTTRPTTARTDGTGWGLYVNEATGQISSQGAASAVNLRRVNGPVYNNSTTNPWAVSPAGLEVVDGGVVQNITSSGCIPPPGLVITGQGSFACTPPVNPSPLPPPTQPLPSSPGALPLQSPNGSSTTGACRVFEPGRYQAPPVLLASNYFKPGVYFFEAGWPPLDGKIILGGGPIPTESRVLFTEAPGPLNRATLVPCSTNDPLGVQFIFGGAGWIFVDNNSRVELHSMGQGDTTGTTLYRLRASDPNGWGAFASTRSGMANPMLRNGYGTNSSFVLHGVAYLPGGALDLRATNDNASQIRGGAVVGWAHLESSGSPVIGVEVSAGESFPITQYVIHSKVAGGDGKSVTVSAVVRLPVDRPRDPIIYSWVVS
ncbi:MAG: hypothetical protein ACKV2O_01145 [Acidimicrobiales bacterium]